MSASRDEFGRRLKLAMRSNAITSNELAYLTGMQPSAISHFLCGRREPSFHNIVKLLSAMPAVDARWLLTGDRP